jgi:hypothetical protein
LYFISCQYVLHSLNNLSGSPSRSSHCCLACSAILWYLLSSVLCVCVCVFLVICFLFVCPNSLGFEFLSMYFSYLTFKIVLIIWIRSQDSDGLHAGWPRFYSWQCKIFLFSTASRPILGSTQSPIQRVLGALSLGVKQQGHDAGHSPPSSVEVKKGGAIPPLPHMSSWHSALLIKHRDNFYLLIIWIVIFFKQCSDTLRLCEICLGSCKTIAITGFSFIMTSLCLNLHLII